MTDEKTISLKDLAERLEEGVKEPEHRCTHPQCEQCNPPAKVPENPKSIQIIVKMDGVIYSNVTVPAVNFKMDQKRNVTTGSWHTTIEFGSTDQGEEDGS